MDEFSHQITKIQETVGEFRHRLIVADVPMRQFPDCGELLAHTWVNAMIRRFNSILLNKYEVHPRNGGKNARENRLEEDGVKISRITAKK